MKPFLKTWSLPMSAEVTRESSKKAEMEQALIRLALGVLLISYYAYGTWHTGAREESALLPSDGVMALWLFCCISIILAVKWGRPVSVWRRVAAIGTDVANTTYFMLATPELAAPLYCLYLWFIIGNGFRFGTRYLYFALALAFPCFTTIVVTQPYWQDKVGMGIGLAAGMVAIAIYLAKLVQRLTDALATAEAANLAKRQFVSSISHEMRTPLNAIIGMADLLSTSHLDDKQQAMVQDLNSASRQLLALVNDVLDFSKIEAGMSTVEATPFELTMVIDDTVQLFRHQAEAKRLMLKEYVHPAIATRLVGDPTLLRHVLANFLSNAIKFTDSGSVSLRVTPLSTCADTALLHFEVEDSGIGIRQEALATIFDSFTQADASTTRKYGGTGLGTTIAKHLIELMGGKVGVRSIEGEGTTFWFDLPLGVCAETSQTAGCLEFATAATSASEVRKASPSYSILVADDNYLNRRVIDQILIRAGHVPVIVEDGGTALDMLESRTFDLVVLDMNMPDMTGMDVFRTYQYTRDKNIRTPFIMLSADVSRDLREDCLKAGFDAFLSKPIQSALLLRTIDELVLKDEKSVLRADDGPIESLSPTHITVPVPIVDFSTLDQLDSLGGSRDFVNSLIDSFPDEANKLTAQIENALRLQNPAEAKRHAHALKGTALGIGAVGLSAECEQIAVTAPSELIANDLAVLRRLRSLFAQTMTLLDPYRASREGANRKDVARIDLQ